jgi:hypothetical protein
MLAAVPRLEGGQVAREGFNTATTTLAQCRSPTATLSPPRPAPGASLKLQQTPARGQTAGWDRERQLPPLQRQQRRQLSGRTAARCRCAGWIICRRRRRRATSTCLARCLAVCVSTCLLVAAVLPLLLLLPRLFSLLGALRFPGLRIATAGMTETRAPALPPPVSATALATSNRDSAAPRRLRRVALRPLLTCEAGTSSSALLVPPASVPVVPVAAVAVACLS